MNRSLLSSLEERWNKFQDKCKELSVINDEEAAFTITLLSDAIFMDNYFRYRTDLSTELLEELSGISFHDVEMVYSNTSSRTVSGWNQKWGTATDDEYAVKVGSSYLFIIKNARAVNWVERLNQLEALFALGERKSEGFGRFIICHPFHLQIEEV